VILAARGVDRLDEIVSGCFTPIQRPVRGERKHALDSSWIR
jgi:hypothetical protein